MASFNSVTLLGNLTRDIEVRYICETALVEVGVAVNERVKKGGEWQDEVSYFDLSIWGKQAETVSQYLAKGSPILVHGRLKQDRWQDKTTGAARSKVNVVVDKVVFVGGGQQKDGNSDGARQQSSTAPADVPTQSAIDDSEVPF